MSRKLLDKLEKVTSTIVYHVGFDKLTNTWRILRYNGLIFGNFKHKKNAAEYAKVCATIEFRRKVKNPDLVIDGIHYYDSILEEVLLNDIDLDLPDDIITEGDL